MTNDDRAQVGDQPERQLDVLLLDYEMAREDERTMVSASAATFSVATAMLALLAAAVTQTCQFKPPDQTSARDQATPVPDAAAIPETSQQLEGLPSQCTEVSDYLLAGAPLIPLAALAYFQMLATAGTLRSYYMRAIEEDLRTYSPHALGSLSPVRPASYVGITTELVSMRRGRGSYRLLAYLVFAIIATVFGGLTLYIGLAIDNVTVQIGMAVLYGAIAILLVTEATAATVGGRSLFVKAAERFLAQKGDTRLPRLSRNEERSTAQRPLISYLLLPRPEECSKWVILVVTYWVAILAIGVPFDGARLVLVLFVFEYLIYEARYQWNDVIGFDEDQGHTEAKARRRLPAGDTDAETRRNIYLSEVVGLFRVGLALYVSYIAGIFVPVSVAAGLVFGVAIVYEMIRRRSAEKPTQDIFGLHVLTMATWVVVGFGYAIRTGVGFWAAGVPVASGTVIAGAVFFTFFGIMFVLLTWVLDGTSYCRVSSTGMWCYAGNLSLKPHLAALLPFAGVPRPAAKEITGWEEPTPQDNAGTSRVLERRGHLISPWNLALVTAIVSGAVYGASFAELAGVKIGFPAYAGAAVVSFAGSLLLCLSENSRSRLMVAVLWVPLIVGSTIVYGADPNVGLSLVVLPWLIVTLMYWMFRRSSYNDLKRMIPDDFRGTLLRLSLAVQKLVLGKRTFSRLVLMGRTEHLIGFKSARSGSFGQSSDADSGHADGPSPPTRTDATAGRKDDETSGCAKVQRRENTRRGIAGELNVDGEGA